MEALWLADAFSLLAWASKKLTAEAIGHGSYFQAWAGQQNGDTKKGVAAEERGSQAGGLSCEMEGPDFHLMVAKAVRSQCVGEVLYPR